MDFLKSLPKHTQIIIGVFVVIAVVLIFIFVKNHRVSAQEDEWVSSEVETEEVTEETEVDKEASNPDEVAEDAATEGEVMMADVKGAVVNPGVYEFEEGDRVETLIEKAGGLTDDADPNQVNMAQVVEDEMVIYVPVKGEVVAQDPTSEDASTPSSGSAETEGKVNINTATMDELMTLPGIGETKAQAIIDTRDEKGGYKDIEEIKDAPGIGDSTYEQIKDLIYV